jgi:hypothetical protein
MYTSEEKLPPVRWLLRQSGKPVDLLASLPIIFIESLRKARSPPPSFNYTNISLHRKPRLPFYVPCFAMLLSLIIMVV